MCVGRDVLINISMCVVSGVGVLVCVCSVPLLIAFWEGKFQ